MNTGSEKQFPWVSFSLLLVAYASLGWLLASPDLTSPAWLASACYQTFDLARGTLSATMQPRSICRLIVKENLVGAALAFAWIIVASVAFRSPLTSFSRFVAHWFKSDTVAFLSLCVVAGMLTLILFWLKLFLQITTILASEALARIDLQTLGFSTTQAFWILVVLSSIGLGLGWVVRLAV
ncbi:MAG TPA: hypothetical protein V6D34_03140 [Candidatus Sericytochromatia bacterium]|jgi:hypothetical protein